MRCPNCDAEINENRVVCPKCGKLLFSNTPKPKSDHGEETPPPFTPTREARTVDQGTDTGTGNRGILYLIIIGSCLVSLLGMCTNQLNASRQPEPGTMTSEQREAAQAIASKGSENMTASDRADLMAIIRQTNGYGGNR